MKVIEQAHDRYAVGRRVRVLSARVAELLPETGSVLDVGSGSGLLASLVAQQKPRLQIRGIDVLIQPNSKIPVEEYDGWRFPADDQSVDVVTFVDVLHHTPDPVSLLREAQRVSKRWIVIKDHLQEGFLARQTLRFMDFVGNARFGIALPYNYWQRQQWQSAFTDLGIITDKWSESLNIYGWPWRALFDRQLHFIARLNVSRLTH